MTRNEQKKFLRENARSVVAGLIEKLKWIPEDWGGHELRMLLWDAFEMNARLSKLHSKNRRYGNYNPAAARKYKSLCWKRGLP